RLAFEERVNVLRPHVYIDKKDLTVIGFRKRGSEPGGEGRSSRCFRKAGNTHELRFMRQMIEFKIKAEAIPNCVTIRQDEMAGIPRRQFRMVRSRCESSRICR